MQRETIEAEKVLVAALLQTGTERDYAEDTRLAARLAILDSIGVGLGTLDHPAASTARDYVRRHLSYERTVSVWGDATRTSLAGAVIANSVPLRCYDFNDVMHGKAGQAGHPSDFIPGLFAVAEAERHTGWALVDAIVVAYDAAKTLFDTLNVTRAGWDYANLTGLAAVAGFVSLYRLTAEQGAQALGIFAASNIATNQLESGDLSASGNLTMWKRFNGASAVDAALRACHMAASGVEAPSHSLLGDAGFFRQQLLGAEINVDALTDVGQRNRHGVEMTEFKKWPVGTRAQSAISAAQACREQVGSLGRIDGVEVTAQAGVVRHLVRHDAWQPHSRETADHSLPYIVALALLYGDVTIDQFSADARFDNGDVKEMVSKISIRETPDPQPNERSSFPTRVSVAADGEQYVGTGEYPPEKIRAIPFRGHIEEKFRSLATRRVSNGQANAIHQAVLDLDKMKDVAALAALLSAPADRRTTE